MKTLSVVASLLLCNFAVFSQAENTLVAKATDLDKIIANIDITSPDVVRTYFTENYKKVNDYQKAKIIRICNVKPGNLWAVNDFYANGFLKMEGLFSDLKKEIKEGVYTYYYPTNIVESEGIYEHNEPVGDWKYYYPSGKLSAVEHYEKGKKANIEFFEENGEKIKDIKSVESNATFGGGTKKFNSLLMKQLSASNKELVKRLAVEGLKVSFWVNTEGDLEDISLEPTLKGDLVNQIKKAVSAMPKWTPARKYNHTVKEFITIPIVVDND